jgi:hypothetical protein
MRTTKADYDRGATEVATLTQLISQVNAESAQETQTRTALQQDLQKSHSFSFLIEGQEEKDAIRHRIESETATMAGEESELSAMEANVNGLIQEKSMIDRMVAYDGEYLSLTGLGTVVLNDLSVRSYRVADEEFSGFSAEIKATYGELRSIADRASYAVTNLKAEIPLDGGADLYGSSGGFQTSSRVSAPSLLWGTAIGLAKLRGNVNEIYGRFNQAYRLLDDVTATTSDKLMAAETMTAMGGQDIPTLEGTLKDLDKQLRKQGVSDKVSAGIASTIMAGRRFDGTYPMDNFIQFKQLTPSDQAASILSVMNVTAEELGSKFEGFRSLFASWGYVKSEDTEISSAFLAIGELTTNEVDEKLKYIVEQLKNYLEYPLVPAAILASIPVFESHEALDLMEKAVTLLSGYASGLERSELVALAVRMIHGVRNELVSKIDPAATITQTPVQFSYPPYPGLFIWYHPVIIAHSYYHTTFSGMGGFHPAHSHGVGGFAG